MFDTDVLSIIISDTNYTVSYRVTAVQPVGGGQAVEASGTDRDSAIVG